MSGHDVICFVVNVSTLTFLLFSFGSYALPMAVAMISYILRWIADATCSPYSHVCKKSSDFLSHIYAVVIIFLLIVGATKAKQVREVVHRFQTAIQVVNGDKKKAD